MDSEALRWSIARDLRPESEQFRKVHEVIGKSHASTVFPAPAVTKRPVRDTTNVTSTNNQRFDVRIPVIHKMLG